MAGFEAVFMSELIATLFDRIPRRAAADHPDRRLVVIRDRRGRDMLAHRLELERKPVHVLDVVVRPLAVLRLFVVPAAASEVGGRGVVCGRQGAVTYAVSVHVFVTRETTEPLQI